MGVCKKTFAIWVVGKVFLETPFPGSQWGGRLPGEQLPTLRERSLNQQALEGETRGEEKLGGGIASH